MFRVQYLTFNIALYFNASSAEVEAAGVLSNNLVQYHGGGYIASLGVYHDIHCLNKLRRYVYRDTYLDKVPERNISEYEEHLVDHCIDMLRVSIMCSPDLSMYTFHWPEIDKALFLDATSKSPRKCVDWGQLSGWSERRMVEMVPTLIKPSQKRA
ncbi:hypothetical protein CC78DRAFT_509075 [Lojkania enalia]|uniref:Uncharacterized protein n=1 Tax=Lojkania enalia TaxID=147567 RepID=A0A9P4NAE0_9PLEO|nr:hypothetical protein CC78DRAFT_509075 [Didymosphaeria enalia]